MKHRRIPKLMNAPRSAIVRFILAIALLTAASASLAGVSVPTTTPSAKAKTKTTAGSYCGVYALYAASCRLGHQLEFPKLLSDQYIGSREGSSLGELLKAASEHGLYALPLENMTSMSLRRARTPTILHVKRDGISNQFNHWVLYIGERGSAPVIYDPSGIITITTWDELLAAWDGTALVVGTSPIGAWAIRRDEAVWAVALLMLLAVFLVVVRWLVLGGRSPQPQMMHWSKVSASQATVLLLLGISVGMSFHCFSADGLARHAEVISAIQEAKATTFMRKFSASEMRSIIHRNGSEQVVIDARMKADYDANHLPGAINIPVDMTDPGFDRIVASIPNGAHLILYCQSKGCPFAERVARRLLACGYTNLSMFPGGWVEWESAFLASK